MSTEITEDLSFSPENQLEISQAWVSGVNLLKAGLERILLTTSRDPRLTRIERLKKVDGITAALERIERIHRPEALAFKDEVEDRIAVGIVSRIEDRISRGFVSAGVADQLVKTDRLFASRLAIGDGEVESVSRVPARVIEFVKAFREKLPEGERKAPGELAQILIPGDGSAGAKKQKFYSRMSEVHTTYGTRLDIELLTPDGQRGVGYGWRSRVKAQEAQADRSRAMSTAESRLGEGKLVVDVPIEERAPTHNEASSLVQSARQDFSQAVAERLGIHGSVGFDGASDDPLQYINRYLAERWEVARLTFGFTDEHQFTLDLVRYAISRLREWWTKTDSEAVSSGERRFLRTIKGIKGRGLSLEQATDLILQHFIKEPLDEQPADGKKLLI